ncbi:MAG: hypothetical protein ACI9SY_000382 [Candidatus Paceibacteria bacterium]|jgi:hypothetical protein
MERNYNPRVVGACLVGFALVAGAYVLSTFGESNWETQSAAVVVAQPRVAITVLDTNKNGIEDWRDKFVTTAPIILDQTDEDYELPTTLTGQVGIGFIEDYFRSKTAGPFGNSQEEVVDRSVSVLTQQAIYDLYDTPDVTVLNSFEDADILQYANTMALNITNNNISGGRGEVQLLSEALKQINPEASIISELENIADAYKNMRDAALTIPAPAFAVKQHLDLINTYNALYQSISSMALSAEDPALALIRIKRYQDDALGLRIALENMYLLLEPYASLVKPNDPALLFVVFSSEFNS